MRRRREQEDGDRITKEKEKVISEEKRSDATTAVKGARGVENATSATGRGRLQPSACKQYRSKKGSQ